MAVAQKAHRKGISEKNAPAYLQALSEQVVSEQSELF